MVLPYLVDKTISLSTRSPTKDDNKLSEAEVKTWVDNYKSSLNRKRQTGKVTDPKDKDQEYDNMTL